MRQGSQIMSDCPLHSSRKILSLYPYFPRDLKDVFHFFNMHTHVHTSTYTFTMYDTIFWNVRVTKNNIEAYIYFLLTILRIGIVIYDRYPYYVTGHTILFLLSLNPQAWPVFLLLSLLPPFMNTAPFSLSFLRFILCIWSSLPKEGIRFHYR